MGDKMETIKRMTAEDHYEVASELFKLHEQFVQLVVRVSNITGSSSKYTRELRKALTALDEARCEGDRLLARDYPSLFTPHVYYPGVDQSVTSNTT